MSQNTHHGNSNTRGIARAERVLLARPDQMLSGRSNARDIRCSADRPIGTHGRMLHPHV